MIISASRRTDIPNYYSEWFFNRIKEGFVLVRNPMNAHQISRVPLNPEVVDCIVFWTKNPEPMLGHLSILDDMGYPYYFQYTLNSYDTDVEPGVPGRKTGIETFKKLSAMIGKERVIWRYDPIFFSEKYTAEYHIESFAQTAEELAGQTDKCIISFMDDYPKIKGNVNALGIRYMSKEDQVQLARELAQIAGSHGLVIETCAEAIELSDMGIAHGRCIDDKLIERLINSPLKVDKDKNQRLECGCVASVDIGIYNTCKNFCKYCYANYSKTSVINNVATHNPASPLLCGTLGPEDKITDRKVASLKDAQIKFL